MVTPAQMTAAIEAAVKGNRLGERHALLQLAKNRITEAFEYCCQLGITALEGRVNEMVDAKIATHVQESKP
jgi:hypothetical protein